MSLSGILPTVILALVCSVVLLAPPRAAAESRIIATDDLLRVEFGSKENGLVVLYLPSDIRAGDEVMGRMEAEGDLYGGATRGHSLAIGTATASVSDGIGVFTIPEDAGAEVPVRLMDANGNGIETLSLPLAEPGSARKGLVPGTSGRGVIWLPAQLDRSTREEALSSLDPTAEVVAVSPRGVAVIDELIARGGPAGGVTCCSENTENCGLSSCCVDIPSNSCTFCNAGKWQVCIVVRD